MTIFRRDWRVWKHRGDAVCWLSFGAESVTALVCRSYLEGDVVEGVVAPEPWLHFGNESGAGMAEKAVVTTMMLQFE